MKPILWNIQKARVLQGDATRGNVSFEDCVVALESGKLLDVVANPSVNHPDQKMFILSIENYAYCVPFVETKSEIFLKTIFPSRKFTALYIQERSNAKNQE
jgi:hypothetical protein